MADICCTAKIKIILSFQKNKKQHFSIKIRKPIAPLTDVKDVSSTDRYHILQLSKCGVSDRKQRQLGFKKNQI